MGGGWVGRAEWRGRGFPGFECHFVGCLRVSSSGDAEFLLVSWSEKKSERTNELSAYSQVYRDNKCRRMSNDSTAVSGIGMQKSEAEQD